jgi:hypothetical protein
MVPKTLANGSVAARQLLRKDQFQWNGPQQEQRVMKLLEFLESLRRQVGAETVDEALEVLQKLAGI